MTDTVLRAHVPYATRDPVPCTCTPDGVFQGNGDGSSRYAGDLHTVDCHITRTLQDTK